MDEAEVIDVEGEDVSSELVHQPVGQVSIFESRSKREQLMELKEWSEAVVEFVTSQGLAKSFGGGRREHVQVEGWQFVASQAGLIPDIEWTKELEDGWEARALLRRLSDGAVVSHGEAECRRSESNWKNRDSYAIRSMAQTRAVSKVCRIALSSVMVAAGFAATPAEEIDGNTFDSDTETPKSTDEPHCPACHAVNGELVAVSAHDKKPYWRCVRRGKDCAGWREHNGKIYSWSGWHQSFKGSRDEWIKDNPELAGPQDISVDPDERLNRSTYMLKEIAGLLGLELPLKDEDDPRKGPDYSPVAPILKSGLAFAVDDGLLDVEDVIGPLDGQVSDDQLRKLVTKLTQPEADIVVSAAVQIYGGGEDDSSSD